MGNTTGTTSPTAPAVVIGLDCITGLQTARILAARGVPVVGVVADRRHWGARTRVCAEVVESPLSGEPLLGTLRDIAARRPGRAVLVPCTDPAVRFLSARREDLPTGQVLALADDDAVRMLMDKVAFSAYAEAHGLPAPRAVHVRDRAEAEEAARTFRYPAVLKPASKTEAWLSRTSRKAFQVSSPEELLEVYDRVAGWTPVLLVQEWVAGPETGLFSCNAYFGEGGRPLATFVARKLRQWPPDIGTSASGEECRNDVVLDTTLRLFGELGYRGLAYLEMKRDERTGDLMIIEPNVGRPTGRSAIAEAGGVDLVHTAYCDALGLPLPASRTQTYGDAAWVDLRRDAQAAVVAWRRGGPSLAAWLRWLPGRKAHAIWSWRDPRPFAVDLVQASRTGGKMVRAERRGHASDHAPHRPVASHRGRTGD